MKMLSYVILAAAVLISNSAVAQESQSVSQATKAASSWLKLVDAGTYPASWKQASSLFKSAVTESSWESALRSCRGPLGALKEREVQSATFTRSLPGVPAGEYVVVKYASRFEHKTGVTETVTPMREKDGSWRVAGYYVK